MTELILGLVLALELMLGLSLLVSILRPQWRVWPPPNRRSWQFWFVWVKKPHGRVYFAGSERSSWVNSMEGALESAQEVATEIAELLS